MLDAVVRNKLDDRSSGSVSFYFFIRISIPRMTTEFLWIIFLRKLYAKKQDNNKNDETPDFLKVN